ncbi:unnamed protein product [Menidia menidia]|uniref:(Atlantic silverside) hypothetical protein n=1 Tax=Menidia menidia TaxID=238744 RepID=A0A8S4AV18_9TELE|nr:unnamed protein product [Menidia menidia]
MARAGRPTSESYQPVSCSVSQSLSSSGAAGKSADEDDHTPIFSLSKSAMDVVVAVNQPHKRDPAWTRLDLRRSSSTNTHSVHNAVMLQQLPHQRWRHNSQRLTFTTQNEDMLSPPCLSERWISNMQRWSGGSGGPHSRSSTPDTVVWKGGSSRSCSLTQEPHLTSAPDSPMSKLTTPPTTPSPFISPFQTPTLPPLDLLSSSCSAQLLSTHRLPELASHSPPIDMENERSQEKLAFEFPSPILSPVSLKDTGVFSDTGGQCDDAIKEMSSPTNAELLESDGRESPSEIMNNEKPNSPTEEQESKEEPSNCHLVLPWQLEQSLLSSRCWRSPLVCSLSDTQLDSFCKCRSNAWKGPGKTPEGELSREEATMTSQLEMVDAAVQTCSPLGSFGDLQRKMSTSNTGSQSILGSPPGSRLNLKSPMGSHSNLVSPSSSMFPVSSGDDEEEEQDDPEGDLATATSPHLEGRRSCLKMNQDARDEMGRRCSMKQVQWDEDGLTWDVHGASVDPKLLSTAIQKHLELKTSPQPPKRPSKKKKAPKPPVISNLITTMTPDMNPSALSIKCMVEDESQDTLKPDEELQDAGGKKEEAVEVPRKQSGGERDNTKAAENLEEQDTSSPKPIPHGSGQIKKKTVIRSLRRPRWCGGSRNTDD